MTQDESATPKKKLKKWQIAVLVVIVLSVIGSLTGGDDTSSTEQASETAVATTAPEPEVDLFTKRACRKFREFTSEAGKGVLTISEMRAKFKDTYEAAQFSEVPAITDSATRTLAALTSQDVDALTSATDVLAQTCIQLGQQKYGQGQRYSHCSIFGTPLSRSPSGTTSWGRPLFARAISLVYRWVI